MKITIFDTSVVTENLGDFIIMDAVNKHLFEMFPDYMKLYSLTHDRIGFGTYRMVKKSDFCFVGGTNLLSSNMNRYNQWKINLFDSIFLKNILLMGVGWWQYQDKPNLYTQRLLKSVLHKEYLHSVRDSYTEQNLRSIGITNVINTACATMWDLDDVHCKAIPVEKGEDVVFTLTDYKKDYKKDYQLIDVLTSSYQRVYFWPQGTGDLAYFSEFSNKFADIVVLSPTLESFNGLLEDKSLSLDFVGTRLHAGVRALQHKRRSIIIGVDNRALEKAKDFKITVLDRAEIDALKSKVNTGFRTEIVLPLENIERWKQQFG